MKWKIILPLCSIFLIIGYFLGVYLPLGLGPCEIKNEPITKGDYYGNIINGFGSFSTFAAVICALFLNEIRSLFKKVDFVIQLENNEAIEDTEDIKGSKKAKRYHNSIIFINNGNINAHNCELYIENAVFTSDHSTHSLSVENSPIKWSSDNNIVYIPPAGKKILHLFEIIAPQKQSTPDGKTDEIPAKINMLGLKGIEAKSGKWELDYCLFTSNSKPQRFRFIIEWNGRWEERQTEMKDYLKMKLQML